MAGTGPEYVLRPVGRVESPLADRASAPRQSGQGAPDAWLIFEEAFARGLAELREGSDIMVLTWLHRADRTVLGARPGPDRTGPEVGVFSTRSPDRPNPIGLHRVTIAAIDGLRIKVHGLEAIDGTPVIDIKPVRDLHRER